MSPEMSLIQKISLEKSSRAPKDSGRVPENQYQVLIALLEQPCCTMEDTGPLQRKD
jgi:hypothetical protein